MDGIFGTNTCQALADFLQTDRTPDRICVVDRSVWEKLLPYLLSGISVGGQYALIAVGYTMVYGILRLINFAHGDVFMVSGLMMVYAVTWMPLWLAIPFVIVFTVLLGFLIERVAYKPLRSAPRMSVMISAIGVSYLLQNLALYVTGGLNKNYPTIPGYPTRSASSARRLRWSRW